MTRTALPREYDQGTGDRRSMANPALDTYATAPLDEATICCVRYCGKRATYGAFCRACFLEYTALSEMWAQDAAKKADPAYQVRRAAFWRFLNTLAVFGAFELLAAYGLVVPPTWQSWTIGVGSAFFVAVIAAFFGSSKKVRGTDV